MNSQTVGLRVAAVVFGFVCLAQLMRLALRVEVVAAGHAVPLWASAVAAVVLGGLSVWMWKLATNGARS